MKKIFLTEIMACTLSLFFVGGDAKAALHPHTANVMNAIKNAPDAYHVQEALCGQGGVLREKGILAGKKCEIPAFALIFKVACNKYPGAEESNCGKNADKALSTNGNMMSDDAAADALKKSAQTKGTNAEAILCTSPRDKLPRTLKVVADAVCGTSGAVPLSTGAMPLPGRAFTLLIPAQAKMIEALMADKAQLEKFQKPLERMPRETLALSTRDVNKDLRDILQKISRFLDQTKSMETLSKNDELQVQALLMQSSPFIEKLGTMGIRLNPTTGNVERLIHRWEVVR